MRYLFLLFIFFLTSVFRLAAQDTGQCGIRISLLTASPGEELYTTFGHSALRVTDSVSNTDIVYNYGTFNFDEPGFYTKFIRGKLLYYLSREYFESFKQSYQQENRSLTEQVLNFNCDEKQEVLRLLDQNLAPQNLHYKYDFLFDNCTTRLRDLVEKAGEGRVHFTPVLNSEKTFRNLIHQYLDNNDKKWSKLGIDILLGSRTDAIMQPREVMFLPDYLMYSFDKATIGDRPLVNDKTSLYAISLPETKSSNLTHPFFLFLCFFIVMGILSLSKNRRIVLFLRSFDAMLFFITGLLGLLLVFMWLGTDHVMCSNNYNLLWAWPLHAIAAFFMQNEKNWVKTYFLVYSICTLILVGFWFALPQQMNMALLPMAGVLIMRSLVFVFRKNI